MIGYTKINALILGVRQNTKIHDEFWLQARKQKVAATVLIQIPLQ
ncbi:hypothetical protein THF1C08_50255 [Vibrio jasicida]|uniref:Uncharacterized protein n=1 Tax=Vibrio jasicida TaxID=766224 RepID=A0AAU9QVK3_9VIBR|nr:hypothetical protein THF1C08_50255 [Vibrio jasicida]CAH1601538.1 hypothetical protein THF1A12_50092 [Vibrio jasicida]